MPTRITQHTMMSNYQSSLHNNLRAQDKYNKQLATGTVLQKGSDDPVKAIRSLRFHSTLGQNEQYTQNLKDAVSWMETTDSAMTNVGEIYTRIQELITSSDGSFTTDDMTKVGAEVDDLLNELVAVGNTQIGDRYVFAGQRDKTQPFTRDPETGEISYAGDMSKISMVVQMGADVVPPQDSVNLTGGDVFGEGGVEFLNKINEIQKQLKNGNSEWVVTEGIQSMQDGRQVLLNAHTNLGTRMATYETTLTVHEKNNTVITNDLSQNEDVDMADAIMNMKMAESVYKASLSVGSKILPPSLMDYLN